MENVLWQKTNEIRKQSGLTTDEFAPVALGILFLKFADLKYSQYENDIESEYMTYYGSNRAREDYAIAHSYYGFFLPQKARYRYFLTRPQTIDISLVLKSAMEEIEKYHPATKKGLPGDAFLTVHQRDKNTLRQLLQLFMDITTDTPYETFLPLYKDFVDKFGQSEEPGVDNVYYPPQFPFADYLALTGERSSPL